jgi:hypothetical protein
MRSCRRANTLRWVPCVSQTVKKTIVRTMTYRADFTPKDARCRVIAFGSNKRLERLHERKEVGYSWLFLPPKALPPSVSCR